MPSFSSPAPRFLLAAAFGCAMAAVGTALAQDERAAIVDREAQKIGKMTLEGDVEGILDMTCDEIVKSMGGRAKALQILGRAWDQMKANGNAIKAFRVGKPGALVTDGERTFVVIRTTMEVSTPDAEIVAESYLLGIGDAEGKKWKFADGAGLSVKEAREKLFPNLPKTLELPEFKTQKVAPK